ncbi:hypothetical protein HYALB_00002994 [Hymenoscyphus albidus]|uniref:Peptidase A1 domain-containing protein n=1 Tax=Hymenoscyphus albidus TaxID=595503 RepID=A0A9N9M4I4_9HELO|nr:hypothetical protein HYALB_00002994 [Hymenoscyphus albidus]
MHALIQSLLLLLLASLSLAAPPQPSRVQKRGVFKVERVPNPNYVRSPGAGTRALIKAHMKYKVPLPEGLVAAMAAAGGPEAPPMPIRVRQGVAAPTGTATPGAGGKTGKVVAVPEKGDVEYLSPVEIGGQTVMLDFDSGSSDLWVFNNQLPAAQQAGHKVFDITKSTTFKMIPGATYKISYGDGSGTSGNVGTDVVNIGGAVVQEQAVELATAVSQSFTQDNASNGLLGLAFTKLNTVKPTQVKTWFDNVMPQLAMPVFTADLRKNAVGAYEFGAIDSTKFNGTMQWAPVNTTNGFWQFSTSSFQVGTGAPIQSPGAQAIADTGTTLMLTSAAVVNAYYSQVQGAVNDQRVGGVTFPCNTVLPDMKFDVGGAYMATVRGSDINFAQVDNTGKTCFGGIQAINSNLQIYGDILFKSQFVAFNGGNNSLGMAPHQ